MTPKEIQDYYDGLKKKGRAEFKLVFRAAPGDDEFQSNDPVADVTVVAKDPSTCAVIYTQTTQMSASSSKLEVEITVLSVSGILKKAWDRIKGRDRLKPYEVTVTVQPHKGWDDLYNVETFPLSVNTGRNSPIHVWMPAKPGKNRILKLDKPKTPPPIP
jgi:hypothetical protein